MFNSTHTTSACLLSAALLSITALPALSDTISRGCAGRIYLSGDNLPPINLVELDARGTCEGRSNADQCRLRAHETARRCISSVRNQWQDHDIPNSCLPSTGLRTGMNFFELQGIYSTLPRGNESIEGRIIYESCCSGAGRLGQYDVSVEWVISGNDGCGGRASNAPARVFGVDQGILWETLGTNCTAAWDNGICTGPRPQGTRTNPSE